MAATIDTTVKGTSANSYVTLAEAIAYLEERVGTAAWDAATADGQNRALISATRRIDNEVFEGQRTTLEQALAWPRAGAVDDDGFAVDADTIPDRVKRAQIELAFTLVGTPTLLANTGLEAFSRIQAGPLSATLRDTPPTAGDLPEQVRRFLSPFLETPGPGSLTLVRG